MSITYFLIRPKDKDYLIFIVLSCFLPVFDNILQILLLVLLVKFRERRGISILLIPIIIIKELGAWIGFGYLLLSKKRSIYEIFVASIFSIIIFLFIRILIGDIEYPPNLAPFFTPPYIFNQLLDNPQFILIHLFINIIPLILILFYTIQGKFEKKLLIWNVLPICLFAIFWESQLWLPVIMIILMHRKLNKQLNNICDEIS
ncbi:MAG: hypothetical protein KGD63_03015 [Candidatus Lokiarchaeota archaeon]|nr:hypothetical protein [Candidatus Lokiarchaeota archaeon]